MAIEIISTLKPKNNGTFPIAEAKDIDVNGTRLDEKLDELSQGGGGTVSGGGIIDVTELPTENIDESAIYRVAEKTITDFYYGVHKERPEAMRCILVDELPTSGEACYDPTVPSVVAYYNKADGEVYGYVTSALSSVMGVHVGWYPAASLFTALGKKYGGVIHDLIEVESADTYYVYIYTMPCLYYAFKNGEWTCLSSTMKKDFKSIISFVAFLCNNPYLRYFSSHIHNEGGSIDGFGVEVSGTTSTTARRCATITSVETMRGGADISGTQIRIISVNSKEIFELTFAFVDQTDMVGLLTNGQYRRIDGETGSGSGSILDFEQGETITVWFSVV